MALESIVRPDSTGESEERDFTNLRPRSFAEYIGQREIIDNLKIAVQAAMERGEPLDHLLFHGPPGLGKTTLAYVIAEEMRADIVCTSGPALERPADLVGILTNLKRGDILFIDEIHRLPRIVEEYIYPAMEDFEIDMVIDPGPHARTVKLELSHFTIVGATTRAGLITGPLRDRFGFSLHLEFYDIEDLRTIITRSAGILSTSITGEGSQSIAFRSRGTPRIANRLLKRTRDYAQVMRRETIDEITSVEAMDINGVDEAGLDRLDRNYLTVIIKQYSGGPVGVSAIAATLSEERDTLIDVVEPFLLARGFLNRTSRGRIATAHAYRHLGFTRSGQEELPL
ncbi:MAG: Holliday junction branch migration DNA helicase RuvB [Candidatus Fermentibacteraceae bacterium]|nr:Holliday junction branch migration DNA helicase RuvB [Candidatus Fermentibacteraceae bacterium]